MPLRIGQRVVCIADNFGPEWTCDALPAKGQAYTVRAQGLWPYNLGLMPAILLEEIHNHERAWESGITSECWFWAARFRPVAETDISIFTKMLSPEPAST